MTKLIICRLVFLAVAVSPAIAGSLGAISGPNLLPNPELRVDARGLPLDWTLWSPRPELAPVGAVVERDGGPALSLRVDRFERNGGWRSRPVTVEPGKFYRFELLHQSSDLASETTSLMAVVSWYRSAGQLGEVRGEIQRDYIMLEEGGAWRPSARTVQCPPEARAAQLHLGLRWAQTGAVFWKNMRMTEVAAPAPRKVRIAATRLKLRVGGTIESNTAVMAEMFDRAGKEQPDIVLFSEGFAGRGVNIPLAQKAQPIPGPLTDMLAEKAKKYRTYVINCMHERDGELLYNTAVLIDREGRITGKYRKVHLTIGESDNGLTPGNEYPVFDTDFGRIGIMICWDNWFSEPARALRLAGAEIVFVPLAGDGDLEHWSNVAKARAMDNGLYFVSSPTVTTIPAQIINPAGEIVAEGTGDFGLALKDIDLNQEWRRRYLSANGLGEAKTYFLKERRPETYSPLTGQAWRQVEPPAR